MARGRALPQTLEVEADSVAQARQRAVDEGFAVVSAEAVALDWRRLLARQGQGPRIDVTVFVEQLLDLLRAGLNLVEALGVLTKTAATAHRAALEALADRLREGQRLSDALGHDAAFPPLLVALVRASELTSDLPEALSRFLEHERRVAELRHRVISTSIYPLLLIGVGTLVLVFLLFYVMPRFARVFEGMSGSLPWSAQAMVAWAQWLRAYGSWLLAAAVLGGLALSAVASSPAARGRAFQRLMQWPALSSLLRTYYLARWYRATGMLASGGIALPEAMNMTTPLLPHGLRAAGQATEQALRDGLSPAHAHERAGTATTVAQQLMAAGERTGNIGAVLARIAQFHDAEISRALERAMRAIEPVVMVLIGLGIGLVVVLMYLPIFELAAAIQ